MQPFFFFKSFNRTGVLKRNHILSFSAVSLPASQSLKMLCACAWDTDTWLSGTAASGNRPEKRRLDDSLSTLPKWSQEASSFSAQLLRGSCKRKPVPGDQTSNGPFPGQVSHCSPPIHLCSWGGQLPCGLLFAFGFETTASTVSSGGGVGWGECQVF